MAVSSGMLEMVVSFHPDSIPCPHGHIMIMKLNGGKGDDDGRMEIKYHFAQCRHPDCGMRKKGEAFNSSVP